MRRRILALFAATAVGSFPAIAAKNPAALPPSPEAARQATAALEELLAAYAAGNLIKAEEAIDSAMIGRQLLVDAMRTSSARQKQLRIALRDTRAVSGDSLVVVQTGWEKRFLALPAMTPELRSGRTSFMLHKRAGTWYLTGMSGDNVFAP